MEVGRAVAGNHRQPAAERRRIAQAVEPVPGGKEDVLDQIVDVASRHPGQEQAVDDAGVAIVQARRTHPGPRARAAPTRPASSDA